jgi:hypothetical protein
MNDLKSVGVELFSCPESLTFDHDKFQLEQLEFIDTKKEKVFSGVGLYANPSSFHHPEVRRIRLRAYKRMLPIFQKLWPGYNLEIIFNCFCTRYKNTSNNDEPWHRQFGAYDNDDIIYDGWINLDPLGSPPQPFSCLPGTHSNDHINNQYQFNIDERRQFSKENVVYLVEPGHMLVYDQTIIKETWGRCSMFDSHRLNLSYRLTRFKSPLYSKHQILTDQSVPPIFGAFKFDKQQPVMWEHRFMRFWKDQLLDFQSNLRPECNRQVMPSLKEAGLPLFPPYTPEEKEAYYPRKL